MRPPLIARCVALLLISTMSGAPAFSSDGPVLMAPREGKPQTGLRVAPLFIETASGHHSYQVEVAETAGAQAIGLMFRRSMDASRGMLFPLSPPRKATFYMRNTFLPLDIIFIDAKRRVINVERGHPLDEGIIAAKGTASAVLELNAGEAQRIGLRPGDKIRW